MSYKLAACLGKFNNYTEAHARLVSRGLALADKIVIVFSNGKYNADFELRKAIAIEVLKELLPDDLHRIEFVHGDFKAVLKLEADYFVCGEDRFESFEKSFYGTWTNVIKLARPLGAMSSTLVRTMLNDGLCPWFYNEEAKELAIEATKQYEERQHEKANRLR